MVEEILRGGKPADADWAITVADDVVGIDRMITVGMTQNMFDTVTLPDGGVPYRNRILLSAERRRPHLPRAQGRVRAC